MSMRETFEGMIWELDQAMTGFIKESEPGPEGSETMERLRGLHEKAKSLQREWRAAAATWRENQDRLDSK